ncbi:MAG: hypothetical protein QJR03_13770 [Sphaerobacter sp.]|nr:hypothetical protein [Sphaerobacter sp.]
MVGSIPALALAAYLPMLVLHTVATSHMEQIDRPRIEVRHFGDPERALVRILADNITTVEQLDAIANDPDVSPLDRLVFANAPLLLETPGMFSGVRSMPLGLYYTASVSRTGETQVVTIRYYLYFTGEDEGTPIRERMARYGHPFDGELLFQVTFVGDRLLSAYFQAPGHRLVPFRYRPGQRVTFAIASPNHNFRLVLRDEGPVVAFRPQNEFNANPFHDPDFVALAARQARQHHNLDISHYVYIAFQNPLARVPVDVSVRVRGQWHHLHDVLLDGMPGPSLTVQGYHQVAIRLGFTPRPEDIDEVRIVARSRQPVRVAVFALYVYPEQVVVA